MAGEEGKEEKRRSESERMRSDLFEEETGYCSAQLAVAV